MNKNYIVLVLIAVVLVLLAFSYTKESTPAPNYTPVTPKPTVNQYTPIPCPTSEPNCKG